MLPISRFSAQRKLVAPLAQAVTRRSLVQPIAVFAYSI
jgi:hypothetical protein